MYKIFFKKHDYGFTLIEALVGIAVFLIVSISAYKAYISLFKLVDLSQYKVLATALANEQFEIARNMPYSKVGVQGSVPSGDIPYIQNLVRGGVTFTVSTIVRNVDLPFDGTIGGSPNDLSPADNKLLQITVSCSDCRNMQPIVVSGRVAPKGLETASVNGALFIRVFDANGQPIQGASVNVKNIATTTATIEINDVTDENGLLQLVDVPPEANAYRIVVTKPGYSTDRTYATDINNPIIPKPDATVLIQQVTQVSFAIDKLSKLNISSVTTTCTPVGNFDFSLTGEKLIAPVTHKYNANHVTDGGGLLTLNSLEWDIYTLLATDTVNDLIGINPLNPLTVNPDSETNLQLVVAPKNPNSLLVTIKDNVTQLPLSDATVRLVGPSGFDSTQITGRGYLNQTNWSGGAGQTNYVNPTAYAFDDSNFDTTTLPGQITLKNVFGNYNSAGWLESSIFDTGSDSNFYSLIWSPNDQPVLVGPDSVRMQFATAASTSPSGPWEFVGPDGTTGSFYTSSNSSLNSIHSQDRYAKYRLYLNTADPSSTPNISDISFTYTSDCVPPGQVVFSGLSLNQNYTLTVTKGGYTLYTADILIDSAWLEKQVLMSP